ncbi:MAG TPA: hypothetical protein VK184_08630 [Nostocaceae cyanobacterium]|nr:hypothetical protein [Nostocaceae cyanobacterium]
MSKIWKQISRIGLTVNGLVAFTFNSAIAQVTPIFHKSKDVVVETKTNTKITVVPGSTSQAELSSICSHEGSKEIISVYVETTRVTAVCDPEFPFYCVDANGEVIECIQCCPNGV